MIVLDLSILNQKGTPMFYSDITANRPAAGIAGRIFIATDSPYGLFRDTGSAWEQVAGSGGGGGISGSGAATQVAFWNGTSSISGSNNLWWDSTNNYFGINTNTPGNPLDVHGNLASIAALNQTTATNNTLLSLLNSGTPLWRIGNYYNSGANDFAIFDVVGALQQITIVNTTGQTFIGAKTTASGRLVVNSATADNHLQIIGANSPSIRIDNAGSGGTQRFAIGNATATNNFIQGSAAGQFCITTASSGAMLFGMWQTTNATEVMRISTANNLLIGLTIDTGQKLQVVSDVLVAGLTIGKGGGSVASNTAIGSSALNLNSTGANNVAVGFSTLSKNTASNNVAIGYTALTNQTSGSGNVGIGSSAMSALTTGASNIGIGVLVLNSITTQSNNVAIGDQAMINATTSSSVAIGRNSLQDATNTGNVAIGSSSLQSTSSGANNTSIGTISMQSNTTGGNNTSVGTAAFFANTTGSNNVAIGVEASRFISGGVTTSTIQNQSVFIGDSTRPLADNQTNQIVIGYQATGAGSNTATIGNASITKTILRGTLNAANTPTSPAGLSAGDIWNNLGILTIV